VIAFHQRHGVDVLETPIWELPFAMTDRATTVLSRDPWEVAFEPTCEGDSLSIRLASTPSGITRTST
jgi:hypothetical protein